MAVTYPPLNTLKPIAENIWIVDGPAIRFGMAGLRLPFPTRMTILRVGESDLFVHSPTPLLPELRSEIAKIGGPRWIVGPNRLHYWWIPEWRTAFPDADVYLAPRTKEQAGKHIDFPVRQLDGENGYPWDTAIATLPVVGSYMTELEFFHQASCTLVLTDLIENFEPAKLDSVMLRWLTRIGGVQDPDGSMPRDMRLTYRRASLRPAVERMLAWQPERVILAHGRWYGADGAQELRRAFDWLLGG